MHAISRDAETGYISSIGYISQYSYQSWKYMIDKIICFREEVLNEKLALVANFFGFKLSSELTISKLLLIGGGSPIDGSQLFMRCGSYPFGWLSTSRILDLLLLRSEFMQSERCIEKWISIIATMINTTIQIHVHARLESKDSLYQLAYSVYGNCLNERFWPGDQVSPYAYLLSAGYFEIANDTFNSVVLFVESLSNELKIEPQLSDDNISALNDRWKKNDCRELETCSKNMCSVRCQTMSGAKKMT